MGKALVKNQRKPAKLEISAGGVVYRKTADGIFILLIKDSYGRWALPKGKIEKGETPEQTAVREIGEETGISGLILKARLGQIRYFYQLRGQPISKIVYNFLFQTNQEALKPNHEVKDARWFKLENTGNKVAYKNAKTIVAKAQKFLEEKCL